MRECYVNIDRKGREMVNHGSPSFPCACYHTSSHQVDVAWHWHEEFELIYLNSGTVRCSAGDRRFLLHSGEAAFINAGVPHTLFQRLGEPYDEHDIVFHARLSHYQDPVTLDELSAQANICKRECQRVFKSVLGLTPSQYFEQYRLSLSVSLLLNTRESIIDISGKCGFQSPSYFTKVFHKRYGLTPTEFRASQAAPPASS